MPEDFISNIIRKLGLDYAFRRRSIGYTQKEVSEKSGLSVFTISTFESGHSTGLTMATYIKLLRAIDCAELVERLTENDTEYAGTKDECR